ncbi:MAG: 2-hydroxyacyl-CoA dehydratase [Firmicutes bacterium]|nr:2-hydroxyacyl-CoA dehydratase [Bacillota bacterium]
MNRIASLLADFQAIAADPKKQLEKYLSAGKKVVGCMLYFCPEELVTAAGMVPFGLWGAEMIVTNAKSYFPSFTCSILQTILELGIKGEYDGISAVMVPLLCDSLKSMDPNWRYGVKKKIPVIPVTHAQNRKTRAGIEFTTLQYQGIRRQLEELSGRAITDEDIAAAVKEYNRHRAMMRRFSAAAGRHPELVSLPARNAVFKSS